MNAIEARVERGQIALGRLIRQFLAINGYKHVQFMQMAHAITGVRWLHSSQISTLKRGAAKNLTGFPLYSIALVNQKIWEINNENTSLPHGTRRDDWIGRSAMISKDGKPLDIGDLWRIYFGETEAPFFDIQDEYEVDDDLVEVISSRIAEIFSKYSSTLGAGQTEWLDTAIDKLDLVPRDQARLVKGVFLGVVEVNSEELKENIGIFSKMLHLLTKEDYSEKRIYELVLEDTN